MVSDVGSKSHVQSQEGCASHSRHIAVYGITMSILEHINNHKQMAGIQFRMFGSVKHPNKKII